MGSFTVEISFAQLAVFESALPDPFNDWTDAHVRQGFAWRHGSVSFRTLQSAGPAIVSVIRSRPFDEASSMAARIIEVPVTVADAGEIEIATITGGAACRIPPAEYRLTFEHGVSEETGMWINLYFTLAVAPLPARIVRADAELAPATPLVMTAVSA